MGCRGRGGSSPSSAQRFDHRRDFGHGADDGDARGDARAFEMVRHLVAHHVRLFEDLVGERLAGDAQPPR
jgi:hypothetical protein